MAMIQDQSSGGSPPYGTRVGMIESEEMLGESLGRGGGRREIEDGGGGEAGGARGSVDLPSSFDFEDDRSSGGGFDGSIWSGSRDEKTFEDVVVGKEEGGKAKHESSPISAFPHSSNPHSVLPLACPPKERTLKVSPSFASTSSAHF